MDGLLADTAAVSAMSPLQHLEWALALPMAAVNEVVPRDLQPAVRQLGQLQPKEVAERRRHALSYWTERKRVTEAKWAARFRRLPEHVRHILGIGKNLLLFQVRESARAEAPRRRHGPLPSVQEMCAAAGVADPGLFECLEAGFPLVGDIPPVPGQVAAVARPAEWSVEQLIERTPSLNKQSLRRVWRDSFADDAVEAAFSAKVNEEVAAGRARWTWLSDDRLVTPRFVKDEGWRQKADGRWVRKVRCLDDLSASGANSATSTSGHITHDGLDSLVAVVREQAGGAPVSVSWRKEARPHAAPCAKGTRADPGCGRISWVLTKPCRSGGKTYRSPWRRGAQWPGRAGHCSSCRARLAESVSTLQASAPLRVRLPLYVLRQAQSSIGSA